MRAPEPTAPIPLEQALAAVVREAGMLAASTFRKEYQSWTKDGGSPVTEADIAVQKDPYRLGRNEAGAAGANTLLVRSRVTAPRRTVNCPVASPITDCPGNSGAWYALVYESYACTPDALKQLNTPPSPRPSPPDKDE